jgi:hypothetical protein
VRNHLGDGVSQNALDWETIVDGVFTDGWDFSVVQLVVQLVVEVVTFSLDITVEVWGIYLTTVDGWDVTLLVLVNLWGVVITLEFSDFLVVEVQVLVDLVQKEFVVNSLGGGWVLVLTSKGWESIAARDHILLSVNVWEDILVLVVEVIIHLTSKDVLTVHILTVWNLVWESVLVFEDLDKWVNVLVEVDGVQEVLLEGGVLPETLEVDGSNIPLEDWVLDVFSEEGDGQVLTEEFSVVDLFEGEDTVGIIDSTVDLLLLYWNNSVIISNKGLLNWETLAQLLLQQEVSNGTLQEGPFLGLAEGVHVHAASGNGGDEGDKDKGFHDEFVN